MMHPRTVIRHAIARAIVYENAAYEGRVFIARAAVLQGVNDLPCVCIYTNNESTDSNIENRFGVYVQKLDIELVVYARRPPDEAQTPKNIIGMPHQSNQYSLMAQDLDSICFEIEHRVHSLIEAGQFEYGGQKVCVDPNVEFSTKIEQSEGGDVPYNIATIGFSVSYNRNLIQEKQYCDLKNMTSFIQVKECK